ASRDGASTASLGSLLTEPEFVYLQHGLKIRAECGINAEVEKQLEMGKKLLAAGQLADALSHFHAAIEGDSDNYIAYYRRATVYLAMGKSKAAIRDLSKVVELKQDFTSARLQRGHLLLKQGKFDEAEDDFKNVLKSNPSNNEEKEAQTQLTKSDELQRLYSQALSAYQQEDYEAAIPLLDEILAVCVWDAELRELRAECYIKEGEPSKAISDLKAAAKLKSDNTEAFYKISRIYYQLGDHELSLSEVRECLKLDQDHKRCFSLYKQVKKLNKQIESAEEFIREGSILQRKTSAEAYLLEDLYEEGTLVCILYIFAVSVSKIFNMRFDAALCCLSLISTVADLGKYLLLIFCLYQFCRLLLQKLPSPSLLMLASLLAPYKRRWNTAALLKITDGLYAEAWLKVRKLVSWAGAPRLGLRWLLGVTEPKWNCAPPHPC
uniref:DnaJ heat shock protein family (Hsp40) member C3 n=1 Tax=Pavo cristatus TaxID=9049 RepID=A0A8C9F868_PAVCR